MIRVFTLLIKIEKLDLNVQQLTNIMLDAFLSSKDNYCRKCGASGMKKLERYERKITDYCNGKIRRLRSGDPAVHLSVLRIDACISHIAGNSLWQVQSASGTPRSAGPVHERQDCGTDL